MAVDKFKPQIWKDTIDRELEKTLIFGALANREFEGDISQMGESVKMLRIGGITVKPYDGSDITFEEMQDRDQVIQINKSNYFAFEIKDVDKVQAVPGLMQKYATEAAYQMADAIDKQLALLYKKALTKVQTAKGAELPNALIDLAAAMSTANVPKSNRWLVVSPLVAAEITKALPNISKGEQTFTANQNAYVGRWGGFDILESNNVEITSTKHHCLAGYATRGLNLAMQLNEIEAGRTEKNFKDLVKGLNLYGCDVTETGEQGSGKSVFLAELEVDMAAPKGE